jgi:hypothetical protein
MLAWADPNAMAFQDAFILEAIEGNGCYCAGSFFDDKINVIVELGKMSEDPEGKFVNGTLFNNLIKYSALKSY